MQGTIKTLVGIVVLLDFTLAAQAASIHRCQINGVLTLTDHPCHAESANNIKHNETAQSLLNKAWSVSAAKENGTSYTVVWKCTPHRVPEHVVHDSQGHTLSMVYDSDIARAMK